MAPSWHYLCSFDMRRTTNVVDAEGRPETAKERERQDESSPRTQYGQQTSVKERTKSWPDTSFAATRVAQRTIWQWSTGQHGARY